MEAREERVLAFAPHPDDEVIGCGGALLAAKARGASLSIVYMSIGEHGLDDARRGSAEGQQLRADEANAVARMLGAETYFGYLRDTRAPYELREPQHVQWLRNLIARVRPTTVYLPHKHEAPPDHAAVFRAVSDAMWITSRGRENAPRAVFGYEVWTPIRRPTFYLPMTPDAMSDKLGLLQHYASQLARRPYDDAVSSLGRWRAIMGSVGSEYAEAFAVYGLRAEEGWA